MKTLLFAATLFIAVRAAAAPSVNWTAGVAYTYDASGNIVTTGADHHVYDVAGRLVLGDAKGIRRTYAYDAFGNRTQCLQDPATDCQYGHTVNITNNRVDGLSYDGAGNAKTFEGHAYDYDLLNMQTVRDANGAAIEYIYTADDQRIAVHTVQQGSWRWTLRDASAKVLREFTSHNGPDGALASLSWTWTRDDIWRGDQLLASQQPGTLTYHYHVDHLGTPRRITTDTDQIVGIHDYHAFGPEAFGGLDEPSLSLLKFTAHERDLNGAPEDGATLDYMHARYYSGMMGRFQSVDPGKDWDPKHPQSWNLYGYVRNNPVSNVDPTGKWTTAVHEGLIDRAFPGLSVGDRAILKNASLFVDNLLTGQLPATAYQHSMRASNETVEQAMHKSATFYDEKIAAAKAFNEKSQASQGDGTGRSDALRMGSLQSVGEAMHMVADAASPEHKGYQVWSPAGHPIESLRHPAGETKIDLITRNLVVRQLQVVYATVYGDDALARATKVR